MESLPHLICPLSVHVDISDGLPAFCALSHSCCQKRSAKQSADQKEGSLKKFQGQLVSTFRSGT